MKPCLGLRLPDGRRAIDALMAPLERAGVTPRVVDVGARNGMFLLPQEYAAHAELVGFEANASEYAKLIHGTTDTARGGFRAARFAREVYHDCAVWDADEERPFYVTAGPGACTMMGAAVENVTTRVFQDYGPNDARTGKSFHALHSRVTREENVKCRRLDSILDRSTTVDCLKLDVEGAELRAMRGAQALFDARRILFVYTEFVSFPYYAEHPVLGDQHAFLRDKGLRLIALEIGHSGYMRAPSRVPADNDRRLLHAGDAVFVLDPDAAGMDALSRHRLGLIAIATGFNSFGLQLMREAGLVDGACVDAIETALVRVGTLRRLRKAWQDVPLRVDGLLTRLGLRG
ncbi:MAG: FkbM family methyltransferase [Tagaea sp.]|nr:FkbM family methyltransferase [Tagaea sp.]